MTAAQKRKSDDARFEVSPLSSLFGGEVTGFDLKSLPQGIDPSAFLRVVSTHGFLVFRDQELTPSDFASISRFCGELEYHVLDQYRMQIQPEIYVISNVLENGKPIGNPRDGFGWHTDPVLRSEADRLHSALRGRNPTGRRRNLVLRYMPSLRQLGSYATT